MGLEKILRSVKNTVGRAILGAALIATPIYAGCGDDCKAKVECSEMPDGKYSGVFTVKEDPFGMLPPDGGPIDVRVYSIGDDKVELGLFDWHVYDFDHGSGDLCDEWEVSEGDIFTDRFKVCGNIMYGHMELEACEDYSDFLGNAFNYCVDISADRVTEVEPEE